MAKKNVYLHIGPAVAGIEDPHAALRDSPALAAAGLATPKVDQEEMDRADIEIRRRHKALGLKRHDVEGAWAEVCRKAFKRARKGHDVMISQPGWVDADYHQVALALDGLVGLRLHIVVTPATDPDEATVAQLVGEWAKFVKKQGRVHVATLGPGTTPAGFAQALAHLVVVEQRAEVERELVKLTKRKRKLRLRLGKVDRTLEDQDATAA